MFDLLPVALSGFVIGCLLSAVLYARKTRRLAISEATLKALKEGLSDQLTELLTRNKSLVMDLEKARDESTSFREKISVLQTTLKEQSVQNEEKLAMLERASEKMNKEFSSIAREIFDSRQKRYKDESKEQISSLLNPLQTRIKEFEKRIEDTYSNESRERFSLAKELKNLQDLNTKISNDAINLTNALKGESKTQGTWGEVILCLLYTSPSPRDVEESRMPSSA